MLSLAGLSKLRHMVYVLQLIRRTWLVCAKLGDEHTENINCKYRAGEKVKAKVLKADPERHQISHGMKNLIIGDDVHDDASADLTLNQDRGVYADSGSDSDSSQMRQVIDIRGHLFR